MGTNCAPLVADLFLFCYEKDFFISLSGDNQAEKLCMTKFPSPNGVQFSIPLVAWVVTSVVFVISTDLKMTI